MAKQKQQHPTRFGRLWQLMLLSGALLNTQFCFAGVTDDADAAELAASQSDQRELLLYLGEFDPELDPVEITQMGDAHGGMHEKKTDAKTGEENANAANEPKK